MAHPNVLKVAIDVAVNPATAGGVAQVILGLIKALGELTDGDERYDLVVQSPSEIEYLRPYVAANQTFVIAPHRLKDRARRLAERFVERVTPSTGTVYSPQLKISNGFYESLGCSVVHFPHQRFSLCSLPMIYNPHDLQHKHFPQFFSAIELAARETMYRAGCQFAQTVAVSSQWVKDDVINSYGIDPRKLQVIPWGSPTQAYSEPSNAQLAEVRNKYNVGSDFAIYPAMTWPHKNHLALLDALAHLRDERGVILSVVCTGSRLEPHWSVIEKRIEELRLASQVRFLGFVPEVDLRGLYRLSQFLIMPTLFESDSSPIYEAWLEGTPVACSRVTSLPIQVLDAAVLFDPYDHYKIADAMVELSTNAGRRAQLRQRGFLRLNDFNWELTARAYRALYRRAAGQKLGDEDMWLLERDWMQEPKSTKEVEISNA